MGIPATVIKIYVHLYNSGHFPKHGSVCELGDQRVVCSFEELSQLGPLLQCPPQEDARIQQLWTHPEFSHLDETLPGTSWLYQIFGFSEYACIDINRENLALHHDLNEPWPHRFRPFHLVTNHGTSEHLFNQSEVFRTIHHLCLPQGLMIHVLPCQGYLHHGMVMYPWTFYAQLAQANQYEICGVFGLPDDGRKNVIHLQPSELSRLWPYLDLPGGCVMVIFKKKQDNAFVCPKAMASGSMAHLPGILHTLQQSGLMPDPGRVGYLGESPAGVTLPGEPIAASPTPVFEWVIHPGTASWQFDPAPWFERAHAACLPEGYLLYSLPCTGFTQEVHFLFCWPFYTSLALANEYMILKVWMTLQESPAEFFELEPTDVFSTLTYLRSGGVTLTVLFKKQGGQPFKRPLQDIYAALVQT